MRKKLIAAVGIVLGALLCAQLSTASASEPEENAAGDVGAGLEAADGHDTPAPHVNWKDFGYKGKDINGGTLEEGEGHMAPPLLAQLFNFAIFLGILVLVAGPRIKKVMVKNRADVKTALDEAQAMKDAAAAKLTEYKKRIAKVDKEVDELVRSIKSDAEAERARIVADAEAQAASLKRNAEDRIAASIGRARAELEAEVVAAAVAAAEKVLAKQVEDSDQNNLVEHFLVSIESSSGPSGGPRGGGSGGAPKPKPTPTPEEPREKRESKVDEGWS